VGVGHGAGGRLTRAALVITLLAPGLIMNLLLIA
jgi:hypothetical protein